MNLLFWKNYETKGMDEESLLEQFGKELEAKIDAKEGEANIKMTKGEALIKSMINQALQGDQRMMANVLKYIEKLDAYMKAKQAEEKTKEREVTEDDMEIILGYYARSKHQLEEELRRCIKEEPDRWVWAEDYL